jgi:hypothetical protein
MRTVRQVKKINQPKPNANPSVTAASSPASTSRREYPHQGQLHTPSPCAGWSAPEAAVAGAATGRHPRPVTGNRDAYARQSPVTDPGAGTSWYDGLPGEWRPLCGTSAQGRQPSRSSVLLASFLRHQGVPARPRHGFSVEDDGGRPFYGDHWVAEYWHRSSSGWRLADAEHDEPTSREHGITFDPLDGPRDQLGTGTAHALPRGPRPVCRPNAGAGSGAPRPRATPDPLTDHGEGCATTRS